ncbi:MAG: class I SAM-dependent methyltransferase [Candidatus Levybacteria bacterium]|nr:class I SAM-dependent methyltransferase [Candidatus Levybacteria bacterium]
MTKDKITEFYNKRKKVYNFILTPGSLYQLVFDLIGQKEKVLDVGCANGNFSQELKKKGAAVYGIEVSPEMAKNSAKVLDEVIVGNIETIKLPWRKAHFDTILLMDILEHLFSPKDVLFNLKPFLKEKGKVIVTIPNVANWEVRKELLFGRFDSEKTAILEEGHIRFFTYDTAKKMFGQAGYKIKSFNLVINYPLLLLKIHNRFGFLKIDVFLKKYCAKLFAYQFIFELVKK